MATKYADRAFISINGTKVADVQASTLKQNKNAKIVPSMTPDGFNRGFVQGNTDIDVMVQIATQNQLSRPKFEAIDYESSDVQLTYQCGNEQFVCSGLFLKDVEDNAGGVGTEVKATYNFGATKLLDAVGNSSLFNISL